MESLFHKVFRRFQSLAREQPEKKPTLAPNSVKMKLPTIPSPMFTGIRSFIWRNNKTTTQTDKSISTFKTLDSEINNFEVDYHDKLKGQNRAAGDKTLSYGDFSNRV